MPYIDGESLRDRLQREQPARAGPGARARPRGGGRARLRAPARRGAPGHQAGEHPDRERAGGGGGLRHRPRGELRCRAHPRWRPGHRHADVHEPRAGGERSQPRRPERHLQPRVRAVRGARRCSAVPGPDGQGDARPATHRERAGAPDAEAGAAGGSRGDPRPRPRPGAGRPVRHGRRAFVGADRRVPGTARDGRPRSFRAASRRPTPPSRCFRSST